MLILYIPAEFSNVIDVNAQPRSNLEIIWYSDFSLCYSALENDEVDLVAYPLSYEQFEDAQTNPDIQLASYEENHIFEIDINNNYSLDDPSVRSPYKRA